MGNMSYCRFQNTSQAMNDCAHAIEEIVDGEVLAPLSDEELRAAKALVSTAASMISKLAEVAGLDPYEVDLVEIEDGSLDEAIEKENEATKKQEAR